MYQGQQSQKVIHMYVPRSTVNEGHIHVCTNVRGHQKSYICMYQGQQSQKVIHMYVPRSTLTKCHIHVCIKVRDHQMSYTCMYQGQRSPNVICMYVPTSVVTKGHNVYMYIPRSGDTKGYIHVCSKVSSHKRSYTSCMYKGQQLTKVIYMYAPMSVVTKCHINV